MSKFGNWLKSFFKGIDASLTNLSDRFWHNTTLGQGLSSLYHNVPMSDIVTGVVNSTTGAGLTPAQREANEFTASEAEKTRQWQEHMRATNFQTQVGDMQAAGLNPALMYASGGSSSTPSGPSASSVAPSAPASLQEMLAAVKIKKEMQILDAQKDNIESQTGVNKMTEQKIGAEIPKIGAETENLSANTDFIRLQMQYYPRLTESQITKINKEVDLLTEQIPFIKAQTRNTDADTNLKHAQRILTSKNAKWVDTLNQTTIDKMIADKDVALMERYIMQFRASYMQQYGIDVPSSGWAGLLGFMASAADMTVVSSLESLFDLFSKALGKAFSKMPETTVNVEQNQQNNTSPGSAHNPYYPSN